MIGLIFSAVFFGIVAIAALVGFMKGRKYVWQYSLARLLVSIAAVIIAIPVTKYVAKIIAKNVLAMIPLEVEGLSLTGLLGDILIVVMAMVIGLFIFCTVRVVIKFILKFFAPSLGALILSFTEKKDEETNALEENEGEENENETRKEKKPSKREGCYSHNAQPASILIGIVGCILGVVVFFAPLTGFIGVVDEGLTSAEPFVLEMLEDDEDTVQIYKEVTGVTGCAAIRFANACGGRLIFNRLTRYNMDEIEFKLKNEMNLIMVMVESYNTIADETTNKNEKTDAVSNALDAFDDSSLIPVLLSNAVNLAANAFENDEEFMGVSLGNESNSADSGESSDTVTDKIIVAFVDTFKGCTPDSIKEDVRTLGNFVIIVIEHDAIDTILDDPKALLENNALIEELLGAFLDNDRLSSLVSVFLEIGMDALYDTLGVPDTLEKPHQNLQDELANIQDQLPGDLVIAPTASDSSSAEKKTYEIKTEKDLKKFIRQAFNASGIDITDAGVDAVASTLMSKAPVADALKNVEVKAKGSNGEAKPVDLTKLETFEETSLLLTKKDISINKTTGITNAKNEAKLLANTLSSIVKITEELDSANGEMDIAKVLEVAGEILDNLANTELIGKETVDSLVVVVFQSEMVTEQVGGNVVAVTNAVNALVGNTDNTENSTTAYKDAFSNIGGMVDTMTSVSESENPEEIIRSLTNTLKGMTPATAEATKHIIGNADFIESLMGDGADDSAEGIAELVSNLFDNIAIARKSTDKGGLGLSEDEYQNETGFIAQLLETTLNMSEGGDEPKEDEIKKYYEQALDSKILTHTITSTVLDDNNNVIRLDPLNIDADWETVDETQEFVDELNDQLAERIAAIDADASITNKAEAKKDAVTLAVAVAAFAGVKTTANGNEIVLAID